MAVVFHYNPSTDEYELTGAAVTPLHLRNRTGIMLGPNPPYPVAKAGDFWTCEQAGKIGGNGGKTLAVGDAIVALYTSTGGLEEVIGNQWIKVADALSLEADSGSGGSGGGGGSDEGWFESDADDNLQPAEVEVGTDEFFELDGNLDIQPKAA